MYILYVLLNQIKPYELLTKIVYASCKAVARISSRGGQENQPFVL